MADTAGAHPRGALAGHRAPRAQRGLLFAIAALLLIFFPLFANGFDFRYVISSFGPLVAAGAFGAWGLLVRLRPLAQRMRAKPQAAPG